MLTIDLMLSPVAEKIRFASETIFCKEWREKIYIHFRRCCRFRKGSFFISCSSCNWQWLPLLLLLLILEVYKAHILPASVVANWLFERLQGCHCDKKQMHKELSNRDCVTFQRDDMANPAYVQQPFCFSAKRSFGWQTSVLLSRNIAFLGFATFFAKWYAESSEMWSQKRLYFWYQSREPVALALFSFMSWLRLPPPNEVERCNIFWLLPLRLCP